SWHVGVKCEEVNGSYGAGILRRSDQNLVRAHRGDGIAEKVAGGRSRIVERAQKIAGDAEQIRGTGICHATVVGSSPNHHLVLADCRHGDTKLVAGFRRWIVERV